MPAAGAGARQRRSPSPLPRGLGRPGEQGGLCSPSAAARVRAPAEERRCGGCRRLSGFAACGLWSRPHLRGGARFHRGAAQGGAGPGAAAAALAAGGADQGPAGRPPPGRAISVGAGQGARAAGGRSPHGLRRCGPAEARARRRFRGALPGAGIPVQPGGFRRPAGARRFRAGEGPPAALPAGPHRPGARRPPAYGAARPLRRCRGARSHGLLRRRGRVRAR